MTAPAQGPETAREHRRSRRRLKLAVGLNTGTALVLAGLLLLMVNYLAFRHHRHIDLSRIQFFALSEKTRNLLVHLEQDIQVLVFLERTHPAYDAVERLLQEYATTSAHLSVEWVEPDRNLARAEEFARRFKVDQRNVVVFAREEAVELVPATALYKKEIEQTETGVRTRRSAFLGEQQFSTAIQAVARTRRPLVCILQGHDEHDVGDFNKYSGYSEIAAVMEADHIELRVLRFGEQLAIPDDCDLLVLPGPKRRLSQPEIDLLGRYLDESGRMMVLLDSYADSGLEPLLEEWGVQVRNDLVVDSTRTLSGRELFITEYLPHPINARLKGLTSVLYLPRSVEVLPGSDQPAADAARQPRVRLLAASSESGWAETDPDENPKQFHPARDIPGPVGVAVAVERGAVPGIDVELPPSRLVVFGDSDFVANGYVTGGNVDWFMSSLNWLLEREELMGIAPRAVEEIRLALDRRAFSRVAWLAVGLMPAIAALFALLVWGARRS